MLGVDPDSGVALGPAAYLFAVNGDDQYEPEIRVRTADDGRLQVLLTGANVKTLSVSQFEASDPTIAACGE